MTGQAEATIPGQFPKQPGVSKGGIRGTLKFIDSARGIAILMVILIHTSQKVGALDYIVRVVTDYGQMGVQLFFVASAYTLCLSSNKRSGENAALAKFTIRRYFRIAPLYYIGILLYFLVGVTYVAIGYWNGHEMDKYSLVNVSANVFFLHGFYPAANNNIVPGGWSIGTEMAFYVLFPLLYFIASKWIISVKRSISYMIAGICFSQAIIITLYQFGYIVDRNNFIYYNLINQMPVFIIGIGYYFIKKSNGLVLSAKGYLTGFIVFTLLANLAWRIGWPYLFSIIPILSGVSFVFLMELFREVDVLNTKLLVRIGQVSYSMYLFHFLFAHHLAEFIAPHLRGMGSTMLLALFYVTWVFLTFRLALLSEKYIEKPGIELGKRIIKRMDLRATARPNTAAV